MSYNKEFKVTGLTCGHCVASVEEEVSEIPAVTSVNVDLVANGVSTVTVQADNEVADADVQAAIEEAGYHLA
mgnify:CR=1 FL=1